MELLGGAMDGVLQGLFVVVAVAVVVDVAIAVVVDVALLSCCSCC